MDIGERIYQRRRLLDLTQQQLAEQAGVVGKTLGMWERGERIPKGDALQKLAAALDTSVAYLMGETDSFEPLNNQNKSREIAEAIQNFDVKNAESKFQASRDLDELIQELASINPDLIVNFRTTRQNWKNLPPETKKRIAQGMLFVLGLGELKEEDGFRTPQSDEDL